MIVSICLLLSFALPISAAWTTCVVQNTTIAWVEDEISRGISSKLHISNILERVSSDNAWTYEFAIKASHEYSKFLYIIKHFGSPAVPSKVVDLIWHQHILTTKVYMDDMQSIFGKYIHHNPAYTETERIKNGDKSKIFRKRYNKLFGEMPNDVWNIKRTNNIIGDLCDQIGECNNEVDCDDDCAHDCENQCTGDCANECDHDCENQCSV
eukprot:141478_1